jgi:hypothetical protein
LRLAPESRAGPDRERDGVVRWRRIDLKRVIVERFGVNFHPRDVGKLQRKLGFLAHERKAASSGPGRADRRRFKEISRARSIENQAELMRHRARELLAGQRTAALNALRGHLAEIGVVAPQGAQHAYDLKRLAVDGFDEYGEVVVPDCVRVALRPLDSQIDALDEAIGAIDKEIAMAVKADETAKRATWRAPTPCCFSTKPDGTSTWRRIGGREGPSRWIAGDDACRDMA